MRNVKVKEAHICESQIASMIEQMTDKHYIGNVFYSALEAVKKIGLLDEETADEIKNKFYKARREADERHLQKNAEMNELLTKKQEIEERLEKLGDN